MHSFSKAGGYIVRASWSMFVVGGPSEQTQTPLLKIQAQLTVTKTCIESSVIKGCERFWVCAGNSSLWLLHNLWPMSNSKVQNTHHPASPPHPHSHRPAQPQFSISPRVRLCDPPWRACMPRQRLGPPLEEDDMCQSCNTGLQGPWDEDISTWCEEHVNWSQSGSESLVCVSLLRLSTRGWGKMQR